MFNTFDNTQYELEFVLIDDLVPHNHLHRKIDLEGPN